MGTCDHGSCSLRVAASCPPHYVSANVLSFVLYLGPMNVIAIIWDLTFTPCGFHFSETFSEESFSSSYLFLRMKERHLLVPMPQGKQPSNSLIAWAFLFNSLLSPHSPGSALPFQPESAPSWGYLSPPRALHFPRWWDVLPISRVWAFPARFLVCVISTFCFVF